MHSDNKARLHFAKQLPQIFWRSISCIEEEYSRVLYMLPLTSLLIRIIKPLSSHSDTEKQLL